MSPRRRGQEEKQEEAGARDARGWSWPDGSLRLSAERSFPALEKGRVPGEPSRNAARSRGAVGLPQPAEGSAPGSPPFHLAREGGREGGEGRSRRGGRMAGRGGLGPYVSQEFPPLLRLPRGLA